MRFIRDMIKEKSRAELPEASVLAAADAQGEAAFDDAPATSWDAATHPGAYDQTSDADTDEGDDLAQENLGGQEDDNLFAPGTLAEFEDDGDGDDMYDGHRDANGMEIPDPEDDAFAQDFAPQAGFDLSALRKEFAANPSPASAPPQAVAPGAHSFPAPEAGQTAQALDDAEPSETALMADLTQRVQNNIDSVARAETLRNQQPAPPRPQELAQPQSRDAAPSVLQEMTSPPRHRETTRHVMETIDTQIAELSDDTSLAPAPEPAPEPTPAPTQNAAPERPSPAPQPAAAVDDTAEFDDHIFDVAAIAAAAQRPTAGRAGRVKTRLLGFNTSGDQVENPFAKAAQAERPGQAQFPVGWLVIIDGPGRGQSFTLFHGVSQIGRGEDQAIRLDFGDNSISRQNHAAIAYDAESRAFYLGHGGKANLVRLNDRPVLSTEEMVGGNHIRIGETTLKFVSLCGADFDWEQSETEGELHVQAR